MKLPPIFYSEDKFFKFEFVLNEEACKSTQSLEGS